MLHPLSCRAKSILSRTFTVAVLLGIPAVGFSIAMAQNAPAPVVTRSGEQISITGGLDPATVQAVQRELAAPGGGAINTLAIESTGGNLDSAMQLGRIVHARKLTIRIRKVCAVFCAELLVPAAKHVIVPKGALLVFTQMISPGTLNANSKQTEVIDKVIARQNAYFKELNVNPDMVYAAANTAYVMKAALSAIGRTDSPSLVPDASYLHNCIGIASVEMPDFTVSDSAKLAHVGKNPIAFLIAGNIYYEGIKLAAFQPHCPGD
jgi:hypothetical protein